MNGEITFWLASLEVKENIYVYKKKDVNPYKSKINGAWWNKNNNAGRTKGMENIYTYESRNEKGIWSFTL